MRSSRPFRSSRSPSRNGAVAPADALADLDTPEDLARHGVDDR